LVFVLLYGYVTEINTKIECVLSARQASKRVEANCFFIHSAIYKAVSEKTVWFLVNGNSPIDSMTCDTKTAASFRLIV